MRQARIRTIKPEMWLSEHLVTVGREARLLFIGMISNADDEGRLHGSGRRLKHSVFPFDDDLLPAHVEAFRDELAGAGLIDCYEVDGTVYVAIPKWEQHQKIDKPTPSDLPAPPDDAATTRRPIVAVSPTIRRDFDETSPNDQRAVADVSTPGPWTMDHGPDHGPWTGDRARDGAVAALPAKTTAKTVPKPNRVKAVIDAIRAELGDVAVDGGGRNAAAVRDCTAPPEEIAAAYVAAYRGDWPPGDSWLRNNLSMHLVCSRIDSYRAWVAGGGNGRVHQARRQRGVSRLSRDAPGETAGATGGDERFREELERQRQFRATWHSPATDGLVRDVQPDAVPPGGSAPLQPVPF